LPACLFASAAFTSAFEVGNKVSELLMLRHGCDVCCTSEEDKARFVRVDAAIMSALMGVKDQGAAPGTENQS
jgi:hypothetical protein